MLNRNVQPGTADGQPDISGYWATATYTPLERPQNVTKEYYTLEEVIAAEERAKEPRRGPDRTWVGPRCALRQFAVRVDEKPDPIRNGSPCDAARVAR
jgi:hypothetical protein